MGAEAENVTVIILGKEYKISCPPAEKEALRQSARYLDDQMARIKARGSTLGFEKIAVMAALNISHELLQKSREASSSESEAQRDIKGLEEKVDLALKANQHIEM